MRHMPCVPHTREPINAQPHVRTWGYQYAVCSADSRIAGLTRFAFNVGVKMQAPARVAGGIYD